MRLLWLFTILFFSYLLHRLSHYLSLWISSLEDRGKRKTSKLLTWVLLYPFFCLGVPGMITLGAFDSIDRQRLYRRHIEDLRKVRTLARAEGSNNDQQLRYAALLYDAPDHDQADFDPHFWMKEEYDRMGL